MLQHIGKCSTCAVESRQAGIPLDECVFWNGRLECPACPTIHQHRVAAFLEWSTVQFYRTAKNSYMITRYSITQCSIHKQSHKPNKRLLYPFRGV